MTQKGAAVAETMAVKAGPYHVHVLHGCVVFRCFCPGSLSVTEAKSVWPASLFVELRGTA